MMIQNSSVILRLEQISLRFSGFQALDQVNLHVPEGSCYALIGPNGAGKTSLFNCLSGLYRPTAGRIMLGQHALHTCSAHYICRLGMVRSFQQPRLFNDFTVWENLQRAALGQRRHYWRFWPTRVDQPSQRALYRILEQIGLDHQRDTVVSNLSHGQQKQLDLALCLVMQPKILLLDEPTAGMSALETAQTTALLRDLVQEYTLTLLFSEHDMEVVFGLADYVTVLHAGCVLASDTPEAIRADPEVQKAYLGQQAKNQD